MRLLHLDHEGVKKLIEGMEQECIEIKRSSLTLTWYMRGGVSYEDVLNMSIEERKLINELIEENLETTKKTQMPFF
jgi:hypothetical protein